MPEATGRVLGICFIITAILLLIASFVKPKDDVIDHKTSCIMGIAQGLATADRRDQEECDGDNCSARLTHAAQGHVQSAD